MSGKGLSFGDGYTCWYCTQIKGNYLFHSVSDLPGSKTKLPDGRLGVANSHGCVRLEIGNAKWMYDNVPYRSKIYIY
ncbi:L,D-transpeptidase [Parvibacter caecicola]|uniref:L,D-transpeptidase n=1 Tax=Parvibacter caecicola TaxID=747645 RepID=UPI001B873676